MRRRRRRLPCDKTSRRRKLFFASPRKAISGPRSALSALHPRVHNRLGEVTQARSFSGGSDRKQSHAVGAPNDGSTSATGQPTVDAGATAAERPLSPAARWQYRPFAVLRRACIRSPKVPLDGIYLFNDMLGIGAHYRSTLPQRTRWWRLVRCAHRRLLHHSPTREYQALMQASKSDRPQSLPCSSEMALMKPHMHPTFHVAPAPHASVPIESAW
jgi:hypothetical protein